MKERCLVESTPVPTIYEDELVKLRNRDWDNDSERLVQSMPTFTTCKTSLYPQRSKTIPQLPNSRQEINLEGKWRETTTGDNFLLIDDGDQDRILIFSTHFNLSHLTAASTLYGDGTFYSCPSTFYQLYSLHSFVDGAMYPLVFALLPGKDQVTYNRFFQLLKDYCQNNQLQLQPETIVLDYETAAHNAASTVFPGITKKGCFFHYTKCIWRKTQECGLQVPYSNNEDIHRLVRRAAVLPMVPTDEVEDVWFQSLQDLENIDTDINTARFTDYVTEYWVEGNRHLWNHYNTVGPRTTNNLEGWHSKIKKIVQTPHPNIYKLIELLQRQEAASRCQMLQYAAGGKRINRKRKYREIETSLGNLKQRHANREMTTVQFADSASYLLHL
ncbi:uncharacterized protein LOC143065150 [Mytilus galloprovincialis]|uniref:uncharacterized protein LOC143065150 n=1 Tax=Mytilus galloprovincialis TaxID=29158 RepID=UPI003F7B4FE0